MTTLPAHPGSGFHCYEIAYDGQHLVEACDGIRVKGKTSFYGTAVFPGGSIGSILMTGVNASIRSVLIYNRALTAAERRAVLASLATDLTDTDHDGLPDWRETEIGTNPNLADTDGDGLSDGAESTIYFTDPLVADSDGDYVTDGQEIALGTDPNDGASNGGGDTDGDGISDRHEQIAGTDARDANSTPTPETHATVHVTVADADLNDDVWSIDFQELDANGQPGASRYVVSNDTPTETATADVPVRIGTKFRFTLRRKPAGQQAGTDEYRVSFAPSGPLPSGVLWIEEQSPANSALSGSLTYGSGGTPPDTSGLKWAFKLVQLEVKVSQSAGEGWKYEDFPSSETVATNLFALWPNESANIRIMSAVEIAIPSQYVEWTEYPGVLTVDPDKTQGLVKWTHPIAEPNSDEIGISAQTIELKLGEKKHEILFSIPDVGEILQHSLAAYIAPDDIVRIGLASIEFQSKTESRFGRGPKHDAVKHASWSAWITQLLGREDAQIVTTAHEATGKLEGYPAFDSVMDLWNNSIGREAGVGAYEAPEYTRTIDEWIEVMVQAFDAGELIIWWPMTEESRQSEGILRKSDTTLIF